MTTTDGSPAALDATAVADRLREMAAAELKIDAADIPGDAVLKQLPGADSVRLMRIVARAERDFDLEFDDEDIFKVRTLDELVGLVLGQGAASR
ncbi:MAG TPA: acyl carrier protein [Actinospica sp.]|jgi:acyl carrier protein|nr:acyl carrier protein [Actinospica sp.]